MNMAAKGNISINNLAQTAVQHPAFQEMINSILTATNQDQSTNTILIALVKISDP